MNEGSHGHHQCHTLSFGEPLINSPLHGIMNRSEYRGGSSS